MKKNLDVDKLIKEQKWKNEDKNYLFELQKFLDLADNIEDEELKKMLISQMIRCDRTLTGIAERTFKEISKLHK